MGRRIYVLISRFNIDKIAFPSLYVDVVECAFLECPMTSLSLVDNRIRAGIKTTANVLHLHADRKL